MSFISYKSLSSAQNYFTPTNDGDDNHGGKNHGHHNGDANGHRNHGDGSDDHNHGPTKMRYSKTNHHLHL